MFERILVSALFAGAVAGIIGGALQLAFVQPILLHAELYEAGAGATTPAAPESNLDLIRNSLSLGFAIMVYCGYGLMLVAAMALAETKGHSITPRQGIIWGIAGFIVFHLAPGFSLAPETPGNFAAELNARQIWWFATVIATASALWLIAFGQSITSRIAAIAFLLTPHLIGAPQPDTFSGTAPPELAALFASRAFGVGLISWTLLGLSAGYFLARDKSTHNPSTLNSPHDSSTGNP